MIAILVSSNMKVSPIGYYGVGADREGANTDDGGWGGVEAETAWRELVEPAQVFHDRDASRQQRGVHRACRAAGVVDVDRVDANQCGLPLDQPVGRGSGEEGVLGAVAVGAPVTVPAGVGTPPVLGRGSRRAHGTNAPSHGPGVRYPQARAVGWTPLAVSSRRRRADSRRTRSTLLMKHAAATGPVGWSLWVSLGRCWRGAEVVGEGRQISGLGCGQVGERRGG